MIHAKAQFSQAQNLAAVRHGKGAAIELPRGAGIPQFQSMIDSSPRMAVQRKKLQSLFRNAVQMQKAEEAPLQGKFAAAQHATPEVEDSLRATSAIQRVVTSGNEENRVLNLSTAHLAPANENTFIAGGAANANPGTPPLQLLSFARFSGISRLVNWFYDDQEERMLGLERRLGDFLRDMQPSLETKIGPQIESVQTQYNQIRRATINKQQYAATETNLGRLFDQLDQLSSRIAAERFKYGEENDDLMNIHQARNPSPRAGAMAQIIVSTVDRLPEEMQTRKNRTIIKEALHPDVEFNQFKEEYITAHDLTFARERGAILIRNLWTVYQRITGNWEGLAREYRLRGRLKSIELTGSDFHNLGQQVAIIGTTEGQQVVYKPRSVAPDSAVMGHRGSAFTGLNELSEGRLHLATLNLNEAEDRGGHFSFAQFATHVPIKSASQVKGYYRGMGELTVAAKLLGMNDLHNENIMATGGGPVVIDAETSFLPNVMASRSFASTEISGALRSFTHIQTMELQKNYFVTPEENAEWERMTEDEKDHEHIVNYGDFVTKRRRADLAVDGRYRVDFIAGLNEVLDLLKAKREAVLRLIAEKTERLRNVRLVPTATMEFTQSMMGFHDLMRTGNEEGKRNVVRGMTESIAEKLGAKGFDLMDAFGDTVAPLVRRDFISRDTPIMYFHPATNRLEYHGQEIGRNEHWRDPARTTADNLDWIAALTPAEILEQLGYGG